MISYLKGSVMHKDTSFLILDVRGVGYKVFTTQEELSSGEIERDLWIHTAIRENSHDLYGFQTREKLLFFELLIGVSGIGPKTALGILNASGTETLHRAIRSGNTALLIKVGGIGKKNSEKIVLELQDKLQEVHFGEMPPSEEEDVVSALESLGYEQKEIREALRSLPKETLGTGEKVKAAIKTLSKNA